MNLVSQENRALAFRSYDNRKNFNMLDDINAEPVISIRKNASNTRSKGCPLRRGEVLLIKKLGYDDEWKQLKNTGRRWIAEIVFSSLKRVLGEDILSKKFKAQKVEAGLKVILYTTSSSACKPTNQSLRSQSKYSSVFQRN